MTSPLPVPVSALQSRLAAATRPEETQQVEVFAAVARQYAHETHNYEMLVEAVRLYYDARRKTYELIEPYITHGGDPTSHARTLADFSITRQEWNRRQKEYAVAVEQVNAYFDDCIARKWNPSIAGVLSYAAGKVERNESPQARDERHLCELAGDMLTRYEYSGRKRAALVAVRDTFGEAR